MDESFLLAATTVLLERAKLLEEARQPGVVRISASGCLAISFLRAQNAHLWRGDREGETCPGQGQRADLPT